jgi:hypothetical protein
MIRVFAVLFVITLLVALAIGVAHVYADLRLKSANRRLLRAKIAFAHEKTRERQLEMAEYDVIAQLEQALDLDGRELTFLTSSTREEAERLVAEYRRRHPHEKDQR